jgi:hypothetical protein
MTADDARAQDWLDPDDEMGLWEFQRESLTIASLMTALNDANADHLPVEFEFYDGTGRRPLRAVHIDLKGTDGVPTAVVVTVASIQPNAT